MQVCVCLCVYAYPISTFLLQVRGRSTDIRLENCLLHAAAIYEHIFLSGMAVIVAKHLRKHKGIFYTLAPFCKQEYTRYFGLP